MRNPDREEDSGRTPLPLPCSRNRGYWTGDISLGASRLTRRFRNLRPAKANAFKCTSSRRLLTAGYPATAATRVNFRESTIVGGVAFGPLPRSLTPPIGGALRAAKAYRPFAPVAG
jgi:hypothetical protein